MVAVTPAKLGGENAAHFFGQLLFNSRGLPVKPELLTQRLATFRTKKAADAGIMAECARVAKGRGFRRRRRFSGCHYC